MHFSVMVFGGDVEQQLAPFQETNMGPIAPEFMQRSTIPTTCVNFSRRPSNISA
jgi:hypothetical protein